MATVQLGSKGVGSTIKLKVNGSARDFIVVHQGKPSSVYDDSCNGTWLLMKENYTTRKFSGKNNSYRDSDIHSYLNSTFYNLIDSEIRAAIKQVKIPYHNGTGVGGRLETGANGLSTKVFLLSGYEVGWTTSDNYGFPKDGAKLDYFGSGSGGNSKRVVYGGNKAYTWWLRSPYTENGYYVWYVYTNGTNFEMNYNELAGIRPALVLPSTLFVSDDDTVFVNVAPSTPGSISIPSFIDGGSTITISWAASSDSNGNLSGYILERSTDGGGSWSQIYNGGATSITNNVAYGTGSVMYRVKAYDSYNAQSGWRTSSNVNVFNNVAPSTPGSISIPETVKGGTTITISWTASSDSNNNLSGYILERSLDGGSSYSQVYKGTALSYADAITEGWTSVVYRVKAYDSYNWESGYRTSAKRTVINNTAPTLSCPSGSDLGEKNSAFAFVYTPSDVDGNTLTVTEKLDGKTMKTRTGIASGTELTFEFTNTAANFQKILNGSHTLTVEVSDGEATTSFTATFTKAVHKATVTLSQPLEADDTISVMVMSIEGNIPNDAALEVLVTNNAKDASPVWEDATDDVKHGVNHIFTNKTASKGFAFNFKVTVERSASGAGGYINSIGGAFE